MPTSKEVGTYLAMYLPTYLHFLGVEYISQQPVPTSKEVGTYLAMCTYSGLVGIRDVTLTTAAMPRKSYSYVLTLSRQNLFIFVGPLKILIVPTSKEVGNTLFIAKNGT